MTLVISKRNSDTDFVFDDATLEALIALALHEVKIAKREGWELSSEVIEAISVILETFDDENWEYIPSVAELALHGIPPMRQIRTDLH